MLSATDFAASAKARLVRSRISLDSGQRLANGAVGFRPYLCFKDWRSTREEAQKPMGGGVQRAGFCVDNLKTDSISFNPCSLSFKGKQKFLRSFGPCSLNPQVIPQLFSE